MIGKDILEAVRPVIEAFELLGISYYIGGSVASSILGIPRSTLDADIVANIEPRQVQQGRDRILASKCKESTSSQS